MSLVSYLFCIKWTPVVIIAEIAPRLVGLWQFYQKKRFHSRGDAFLFPHSVVTSQKSCNVERCSKLNETRQAIIFEVHTDEQFGVCTDFSTIGRFKRDPRRLFGTIHNFPYFPSQLLTLSFFIALSARSLQSYLFPLHACRAIRDSPLISISFPFFFFFSFLETMVIARGEFALLLHTTSSDRFASCFVLHSMNSTVVVF